MGTREGGFLRGHSLNLAREVHTASYCDFVTLAQSGGRAAIQLDRLTGDRVHLTVNAPREVPILRGWCWSAVAGAARLRVRSAGPARAPAPLERREAGGPGGPAPDTGGDGGRPGGPNPAGETGPHFSLAAGGRRGATDFWFRPAEEPAEI